MYLRKLCSPWLIPLIPYVQFVRLETWRRFDTGMGEMHKKGDATVIYVLLVEVKPTMQTFVILQLWRKSLFHRHIKPKTQAATVGAGNKCDRPLLLGLQYQAVKVSVLHANLLHTATNCFIHRIHSAGAPVPIRMVYGSRFVVWKSMAFAHSFSPGSHKWRTEVQQLQTLSNGWVRKRGMIV